MCFDPHSCRCGRNESDGFSISLAASPVSLADLAGSFSGTTTITSINGTNCNGDTSLPQNFDAAYSGSAAVGIITLHIQGCVFVNNSFLPPYGYAGTFNITTGVGTLAGNVVGSQSANDNSELFLNALSGTGAFAMATGALLTSIQVTSGGNPATINGSVTIPSVNVVLPSNGATVSSTQVIDAIASYGANGVQYELTGGSLNGKVIATATPTYYGWLASWDTTTVPNGTYTLQGVTSFPGGASVTTSPGITITVNNAPPSTSMVLPANNATLAGTSQYLDAIASSGVTKVSFEVSGGPAAISDVQLATATPTIFGWLAVWNTTTVPNGTYTLQSVASYAGGTSASSAPLTVHVNNPPPSTTVLIPSSGATLNPANETVFDAVASPGVTQVRFEFTGVCQGAVLTATPTIYGWIAVTSGGSSVGNPIPLSCSIQSVASYPGGVSGTSAPVSVTVIVYVVPPT